MQIKLSVLVFNTVFTLDGKKYRRRSITWNSTAAKNQGLEVIGRQAPDETIVQCSPFFGGEFQENIDVWVNAGTEVTVE